MLKKKTGKREIAWILTGMLCWVIFQADVEMVKAIIWPILSYVAAASGLHIYQITKRQEDIDVYRRDE